MTGRVAGVAGVARWVGAGVARWVGAGVARWVAAAAGVLGVGVARWAAAAAGVLGVVGVAGGVACGAGSTGTRLPGVEAVVDGPASGYSAVTITAGNRTAPLDATERSRLIPLFAARVLVAPEALSSYGLDPPVATLELVRSRNGPRRVDVGDPTFDGRFIYVRRQAESTVFLVAADALRPVLARVGLTVVQPTPRTSST